MKKFDFGGWATRNNLKCSDGRTILKDAFKHNDGQTVPLVWNHQHNDPNEVLGHAILENRDEGVYAYCSFNESESGKTAKLLVQHGDIKGLSIYANQLKEQLSCVSHGNIREVSLVLAGANPGAYIDNVIVHGEDSTEEAIIYTGETIALTHADKDEDEPKEEVKEEVKEEESQEKSESDDETVGDIINTLNEKQKDAVAYLIGKALENAQDDETTEENDDSKGGNDTMKHNVFDKDEQQQANVLSHSDMAAIIADAKRYGSMKESFLAHTVESSKDLEIPEDLQGYGIKGADDWLFPDARLLNTTPEFIQREMGWVKKVMSGVHHTPFSRIKSMFADIREDEARAKGYIKGKLKKEEVFSLLKRTTTPTTVYKKQKMDRDDVVDITGFDVIAWLKAEMRMMLDEEIARAILVGDDRLADDDDHINEQCIRPIWKDDDLFTIKSTLTVGAGETLAEAFIDQCVRAMKDYRGSGAPTAFMTEEMVTECLLLKDTNKHRLYKSKEELATAIRAKEIVTVPVMENLKPREKDGAKYELKALFVNLNDYNVGADKGGAVQMFDDFDIDYNRQKYLIETRCSGALIKPFSAIAIETVVAAG